MPTFDIDSYLLDVLTKIDDCGWSVVAVEPDIGDPEPGFAYTVGLTTAGHPELAIFGLPARLAQSLLNQVAERLVGGESIRPGDRLERVIGNGLTLTAVDMTDLSELGVVTAVYGHADRALQLVWPDPEGRMPWQRGYSMTPEAQPLFGYGLE
ncbi:DUF4262 domain-containing protein [Microlunatus parietis]|uniref:DUF4262 domain-containing protein n=1 Tax=Microlunatus parietis TaxID=682979 RepID=A0A7Y9I3G6_9ACTN|nr:DUF4262 domain-containing protein [Microlunatus parietis]NYE69560.1 hypothetical protein [Microlunatus parietis]